MTSQVYSPLDVLFTSQPKRVKSLNSGQNLSYIFFGLDFHVLYDFFN